MWNWVLTDTETNESLQSDYVYLSEAEAQIALLYFLSDD